MLYAAYQAHSDVMGPVRMLAGWAAQSFGNDAAIGMPGHGVIRNLTAAYELIGRAGLTHKRPPFAISHGHGRQSRGRGPRGGCPRHAASARCCISRRISTPSSPRVMLVAPLSG